MNLHKLRKTIHSFLMISGEKEINQLAEICFNIKKQNLAMIPYYKIFG